MPGYDARPSRISVRPIRRGFGATFGALRRLIGISGPVSQRAGTLDACAVAAGTARMALNDLRRFLRCRILIGSILTVDVGQTCPLPAQKSSRPIPERTISDLFGSIGTSRPGCSNPTRSAGPDRRRPARRVRRHLPLLTSFLPLSNVTTACSTVGFVVVLFAAPPCCGQPVSIIFDGCWISIARNSPSKRPDFLMPRLDQCARRSVAACPCRHATGNLGCRHSNRVLVLPSRS